MRVADGIGPNRFRWIFPVQGVEQVNRGVNREPPAVVFDIAHGHGVRAVFHRKGGDALTPTHDGEDLREVLTHAGMGLAGKISTCVVLV